MSTTGASSASRGFFYVIRMGRHRTCSTSRFMARKARILRRSRGLTKEQRKASFSKKREEVSIANTRIKEYRQSKIDRSIYKTKFGNLNTSDIIDRFKKGKSVKYSRKLNCHYAYVDAEYSNRRIRIYSMRWAIEVCFCD